jgi:aryl-alcohol dehydrogenase-like predicted oxidoreductase
MRAAPRVVSSARLSRPATRLVHPRDEAVLADERRRRDCRASRSFKQLDLSLLRLKTDYVDLYQCHRYDYDTPLRKRWPR